MNQTFFFYDLETSGINFRSDRVMQFAGQRTDMNLVNIGGPVNLLIKMTEDILPDPEAIMLTGITPQMTLADGLTEAEFLKLFSEEIAIPGTIFTGFNSIRFDDEFMRYMHYRNFYDAYEWHWQDKKSRWDILEVVRLTRALRPGNISWPVDSHGKPTNRLELLTDKNKLEHTNAHDALSDVHGLIALSRLVAGRQPKLFEYLLQMRDKKKVSQLVNSYEPFVYCSGSYPSEYEKTTVVEALKHNNNKQSALVFDLRNDPKEYVNYSVSELAGAWQYKKDDAGKRLPIKNLHFNRCPAVAPLGVLDDESIERLKLDMASIEKHRRHLKSMSGFTEKVLEAKQINEKAFQLSVFGEEPESVDSKLYEGFVNDQDKELMAVVRAADPSELSSLNLPFSDQRLKALLPLYKARNFPKYLSTEERTKWDEYRSKRLLNGGGSSRVARFVRRLQDLNEASHSSAQKQYLVEELRLYAESIMPEYDS